jgi:hypothetical protein
MERTSLQGAERCNASPPPAGLRVLGESDIGWRDPGTSCVHFFRRQGDFSIDDVLCSLPIGIRRMERTSLMETLIRSNGIEEKVIFVKGDAKLGQWEVRPGRSLP